MPDSTLVVCGLRYETFQLLLPELLILFPSRALPCTPPLRATQYVYVQYVPYFGRIPPGWSYSSTASYCYIQHDFSFPEHSGVLNSNQLNRLFLFFHKHKALVTKDINTFLLITSATVLFVSSVPEEQSSWFGTQLPNRACPSG